MGGGGVGICGLQKKGGLAPPGPSPGSATGSHWNQDYEWTEIELYKLI